MKPERIEELRVYAEKSVAHKYEDGCSPPCIVNPHDLLHLLRCARAWAELEALLREKPGCHAQMYALARSDEVAFRLDMVAQTTYRTPDLLTATEAALAKAKETP